MNKVLFVGGSFDEEGGKPSGLVRRFIKSLNFKDITVFNGGYYNELQTLLDSVINYDVVFWWANVPNNLEKIRNVKSVNPKVILITSKNNDGDRYEFPTLINKALGDKSNLVAEFKKNNNDIYDMRIFDPLGTIWYAGNDIDTCARNLLNRLLFLISITRVPSIQCNIQNDITIPDEENFFSFVKNIAETFHQIIPHDETVNRFLGNSSFRCQRGFPSFRGKDDIVFMSQRNVDKRYIDRDAFVPTVLGENNSLYYYGDKKPSVDSSIQLRLYKILPNINYMIHAHCYIENAPFTKTAIPCGGLEEVGEILNIIGDKNSGFYAVNLIGHGCTVMSSDVNKLSDVKFVSRNTPEYLDGII